MIFDEYWQSPPQLLIIVKYEGLDQGYVSRLLKLAFLPPKVVESIVAGIQPADWTVNILLRASIKS